MLSAGARTRRRRRICDQAPTRSKRGFRRVAAWYQPARAVRVKSTSLRSRGNRRLHAQIDEGLAGRRSVATGAVFSGLDVQVEPRHVGARETRFYECRRAHCKGQAADAAASPWPGQARMSLLALALAREAMRGTPRRVISIAPERAGVTYELGCRAAEAAAAQPGAQWWDDAATLLASVVRV